MKRYTLYIDEDDHIYSLPFLIVDNEYNMESDWLGYEGVLSSEIDILRYYTSLSTELSTTESESFDSLEELQNYVKNLQLIEEFRK